MTHNKLNNAANELDVLLCQINDRRTMIARRTRSVADMHFGHLGEMNRSVEVANELHARLIALYDCLPKEKI